MLRDWSILLWDDSDNVNDGLDEGWEETGDDTEGEASEGSERGEGEDAVDLSWRQ
jgi:hypothetical protein